MNYRKIYDQLIERGKSRSLEGYKERHHIVPRCMGGSDDKDNLVELTASEHYVAHQLLAKIYPDNHKLSYAVHIMSSKLAGRNNKSYEWIRKRVSIANSAVLTGKKRSPRSKEWSAKLSAALTGKSQTLESNEKRSISMTGISKSDTMKQNMSVAAKNRTKEHQNKLNLANTGKKRSEETRAKLRAVSESQPVVTCPHCGKSGKPRGMKCWHFDKCKEKPNGV